MTEKHTYSIAEIAAICQVSKATVSRVINNNPRGVGEETRAAPGTVVSADRRGIAVAAGDGRAVVITELQPEGGRRMAAADYLLGHPISV